MTSAAVQDTPATSAHPTRTISTRAVRVLTIIAAVAVVAGWLLARWITQGKLSFRKADAAVLAAAATLVILGSVVRSPRLRTLVAQACAGILAVVFVVYAAEAACRVARIDFARYEETIRRFPTYYRMPRVPVGDVFFRREGPDTWNGKVLFPAMRLEGVADDAYLDEQPVTITYDKLGFRNPDDLTDWDVVVIGDSFTELGYLPYEDLFTTRAAALTGKRVKNLGVCHTGTLTHNHYLREFGKSPSTRHAVLAYFEGNDWIDAEEENQRLEAYRRTGQRPLREAVVESSLLKALYQQFGRSPRIAQNAWFDSPSGSVPVTVKYNPYSEKELTPFARQTLEGAIADWGRIAREHGMQPSLLYIPCKHRVLRKHIRFTDDAKRFLVDWQPSDMPQYVERLCRESEIRFADATPRLTQCADEGRLPYNGIWDTHLNREGSHIVGDALAEAIRAAEKQE